ncbi:MAG: hypothetical protein H0X64_00385 [Gemmatimonadaceae bacterium]|nr:hypothetical protein [Gemmatimonadaceae bacterium]
MLHAIGALKGVTVNDTAAAGPRIALPAEYDGGGMFLHADTAVTTSSSWGTNKLYLIPLLAGGVREAEMPAGANAAGASLAHGFQGAHAAVALRATQRLGLVTFGAAGAGTVTQLDAVGRCPYDVAAHAGNLWVVDYNAACDAGYQSLGDSRLIRVEPNSAVRDTVRLPGVKNATGIIMDGDLAYVSAIGDADYSAYPAVTFVTPGSITVVNLRTRQVVGTLSLPQGTNGATASLGADGRLYVVAYVNTSFEQGVFAINPASLSFAGLRNPGSQTLRLTRASGSPGQCGAATANALGHVYCVVNQGAGQSTSVVVFHASTGAEIRTVATGGTGGVAIALR